MSYRLGFALRSPSPTLCDLVVCVLHSFSNSMAGAGRLYHRQALFFRSASNPDFLTGNSLALPASQVIPYVDATFSDPGGTSVPHLPRHFSAVPAFLKIKDSRNAPISWLNSAASRSLCTLRAPVSRDYATLASV